MFLSQFVCQMQPGMVPDTKSTCGEDETANVNTVQNGANSTEVVIAQNTTDMNGTGYGIIPSCIHCNCTVDIPLDCIIKDLSHVEKFGYTLLFLLLPWPFFIYEFFTSDQWSELKEKVCNIANEMAECKSISSLLKCYIKAIMYFITILLCFSLWPLAVLFIKYYNDGKYTHNKIFYWQMHKQINK